MFQFWRKWYNRWRKLISIGERNLRLNLLGHLKQKDDNLAPLPIVQNLLYSVIFSPYTNFFWKYLAHHSRFLMGVVLLSLKFSFLCFVLWTVVCPFVSSMFYFYFSRVDIPSMQTLTNHIQSLLKFNPLTFHLIYCLEANIVLVLLVDGILMIRQYMSF